MIPPVSVIPGVRRNVRGRPLFERIQDAAHNQRVIEAHYASTPSSPTALSLPAVEDPRNPGAARTPAAREAFPTRAAMPGGRANPPHQKDATHG